MRELRKFRVVDEFLITRSVGKAKDKEYDQSGNTEALLIAQNITLGWRGRGAGNGGQRQEYTARPCLSYLPLVQYPRVYEVDSSFRAFDQPFHGSSAKL